MTRTEYILSLGITTVFYFIFLDGTVVILNLFFVFVLEKLVNLCHKMHITKMRLI